MKTEHAEFRADISAAIAALQRAQCRVRDDHFHAKPDLFLYAELFGTMRCVRDCIAGLMSVNSVAAPSTPAAREDVSKLADMLFWEVSQLRALSDKMQAWEKMQ